MATLLASSRSFANRVPLPRLARYALVGASGVVLNTLTLFLLTDVAHVYYLISSAVATEVAIVSNGA